MVVSLYFYANIEILGSWVETHCREKRREKQMNSLGGVYRRLEQRCLSHMSLTIQRVFET